MNTINDKQTNITKQTEKFINDIKWQIDLHVGMFEVCDNKEEVERYALRAYTLSETLFYTNAINAEEHQNIDRKIYGARYNRIFNELKGGK